MEEQVELSAEQEARRIAAVRRYDILDTPPDGAFDRIAAPPPAWSTLRPPR